MAIRLRTWVLTAGTAAVLGAGVTACGTGTSAATGTGAPASSTAAAPAGDAATAAQLRFPNKTLTAELTGWDGQHRMVEFRLVRFVAGGPDDGHYETDPSDPATHRLPLATTAGITALSPRCTGPAAGDYPEVDGRACTLAEFTASLADGPGQDTTLKVDGDDQITVLKELYHP